MTRDRYSEWFVPKFGSRGFRLSIGMLFLPYTGMVVSFSLWGSMSIESSNVDRAIAVSLLYFLATGVSAHCLDALGSKKKPWGNVSISKLWLVSIVSLIISLSIGLYYALLDSWWLLPIGLAEGFFLFAYNLELFKGKFHNNTSFVISWGVLPVFAGAAIQANSIAIETVILSALAGVASYILIKTSREYKKLKQQDADYKIYYKKELILKTTCSVVIFGTIFFFITRYL